MPRVASKSKSKSESIRRVKRERAAHTTPSEAEERANCLKKRKWKSKTLAKREMKRYQRRTQPILQRIPLNRLIHSIAEQYADGMKFQRSAIDMLAIDLERYLYKMFVNSNLVARLAGRITVEDDDIRTQHYICTHLP